MPRSFDELNIIEKNTLDYKKYFEEMDLPEEEKKKRINLAKQFELLFMYFFLVYLKKEKMDFASMIQERYWEIASKFLGQETVPSYIVEYAKKLADEIVRVTVEHDGEEFYTSKERGMLISVNEANTLGNYNQQIKAIKEGKKYKTWITEKDSKVRHSHRRIDENKIGIFAPF